MVQSCSVLLGLIGNDTAQDNTNTPARGLYQPAQKCLKDRKGRELSWDDVRHYQSILKILSETDRIMKSIKIEL